MKKGLLFLLCMLVCANIIGGTAYAKGKQFKKQDLCTIPTGDISNMHTASDGKVYYARYNEFGKEDRNGDIYKNVYLHEINDKTVSYRRKVRSGANSFFDVQYVRIVDDYVITVYEDDARLVINEYDKKGRNVFAYQKKVYTEKKCYYNFVDVWDDGENIYYMYSFQYIGEDREDGMEVRCVSKNGRKEKSRKKLNVRGKAVFDNGRIFMELEKSIRVYSMDCKKIMDIKLPNGKTSLYDGNRDSGEYAHLINDSFSVCGDYIYYCNKNGIYRCGIKKGKKFRLYYKPKKDQYFGHDYGVVDFCVRDGDTFYIKVADSSVYEPCGDEKYTLVKYHR